MILFDFFISGDIYLISGLKLKELLLNGHSTDLSGNQPCKNTTNQVEDIHLGQKRQIISDGNLSKF